MDLDDKVLFMFVSLVTDEGLRGYMEGTRILHHLVKDVEGQKWEKSACAWLHSTISKTREDLKSPEIFEAKGKGKGKGSQASSSKGSSKGHGLPR